MTTKKGKTQQIPPSRARYEEANPTVSIRVSRELKGELDELKIMGQSMAVVLQAGLDRLKPDIEQSYERGYVDGYEVAEEEFKVLATCSRCGKAQLPVAGEKMKAAVARTFIGWYSTSCK